MSFTQVAIEGQFLGADGSPASGTICVTPNSALINSDAVVSEQGTQPICGVLDSQGRIVAQNGQALVVAATDDVGTWPIGSAYTFTLTLDGQSIIEFESPVPHVVTTFDSPVPPQVNDLTATATLGSPILQLRSSIAASSMIGQTITSSEFTGTPTVLSINAIANTITLSASANASGVSTTLFSNGAIQFASLQANAL